MRWNVAVAALSASWGLIAVIVAAVELGAEVLVFYRLVIAAVTIALALLALRRLDQLRVPRSRLRLAAVGALLAAHWYLFFETIKLSSVAVALVTAYTAPLFLAIVAPIFLPERRSRAALAAVVPGSAGIVLIALLGGEGGRVRPLAVVTGLAVGLTYATLVIASKQLTARLPVGTIAFWSYVVAASVLAPFLLAADRVAPSAEELGYVVLVGAVFTALSGSIYLYLLRRVTAQAIGVLAYLEPVSAALLAWALLGQPLGWAVIAGGALVVAAGLAVVVYEPTDTAPIEVPALAADSQGRRV